MELERESIRTCFEDISNGKMFEVKLSNNRRAAIVTLEATVNGENNSIFVDTSKSYCTLLSVTMFDENFHFFL